MAIEAGEPIHHFSHEHSLVFLQGGLDNADILSGCQVCSIKICSDPSYGCIPCDFYLHVSCLDEFHQHIQQPLIHPRHSLTCQKIKTWNSHHCDACGEMICLVGYRCDEYCKFDLHIECASIEPTINCENHKHLLSLIRNNFNKIKHSDYNILNCGACGNRVMGDYYAGCLECHLRLHVHCGTDSLPNTIEYERHEHPLTLTSTKSVRHEDDSAHIFHCNICRKKGNPEHSFYCCDGCNYSAHVHCVVTEIQIEIEDVERFCRDHTLVPSEIEEKYDNAVNCYACSRPIQAKGFPIYMCKQCKLYAHISCMDETVRVQHPFHPPHSLVLMRKRQILSGNVCCKACGFAIRTTIIYGCDVCDFYLHPKCATRMPHIMSKSHEHGLTMLKYKFQERKCEACSFDISGNYSVRCVECDINFHVQCNLDLLPSSVQNKHHEHSLSLSERSYDYSCKKLYCDICEKKRDQGDPFYYCDKCDYTTHIYCGIPEVQLDDRERKIHYSHKHFLFRYENKKINNSSFSCYGCEKLVDDTTPAYYCDNCNVFLHDSCLMLTGEISHPFHHHPLKLPTGTFSAAERICHACHKYFNGFAYRCDKCNLDIDVDCASLCRSIKIVNHDHKLILFWKLSGELQCMVCKSTTLNTFYLRCVECNFNIHVMCCPLPKTIEHESHGEHPLTLKDHFLEEESDVYCDYCEKNINLQECVYCCEECHFVVDFNCMIEEVLLSLETEQGEVKLSRRMRKVLTVNELFRSLTEDEADQLLKIRGNFEKEMDAIAKRHDRFLKESFESDEEFAAYMIRHFEPPEVLVLWDWTDIMIRVRDSNYMIPTSLAPILDKILYIYGDVADKCNLTPKLKSVMYIKLCLSLQSMCNTEVGTITPVILYNWWEYIKLAENAGFEVRFAIDHLKKIARARFAIDSAEIQKNSILHELYEHKNQLSETIDKLLEEIEHIDKKIELNIKSIESVDVRKKKKSICKIMEWKTKKASAGLWKHKIKN